MPQRFDTFKYIFKIKDGEIVDGASGAELDLGTVCDARSGYRTDFCVSVETIGGVPVYDYKLCVVDPHCGDTPLTIPDAGTQELGLGTGGQRGRGVVAAGKAAVHLRVREAPSGLRPVLRHGRLRRVVQRVVVYCLVRL